jgi:archaeoflavoprotein AfpA
MNNLKRKCVWGITGSGDEIREILEIMKNCSSLYPSVEIRVYISKAAEQVLQWYRILDQVKSTFKKVRVESNSNNPFLAGELQSGKYDFLIVAPTTSNSTAKMALGIGDTMITNAVNMAVKASVPVYVYPCEIGEKDKITVLPNEKKLSLIIRELDSAHIKTIEREPGITVIRSADEIKKVFSNTYNNVKLD